MKTWADVKRRMSVGTTLTLISFPGNHKFLNVPRKITVRQTNAVCFAGGSWLRIESAKNIRIEGDDTFSVLLDPTRDLWMTYRFEP